MAGELVRKGIGLVSPPAGSPVHEGRVDERVLALEALTQALVRAVNGQLSLGDGTLFSLSGNVFGQWVVWVFPSVADTEVTIPHGLGRVPVGFIVANKDRYCDVKRGPTVTWTSTVFSVSCNTASANVLLLVV